MWEHRNHINTSSLTSQQRREQANLLTQVHQEFAKGKHTLQKEDKHLLRRQEEIKRYSIPELEEWLSRVRNARAASTRKVEAENRSLRVAQRFMDRWRHGPS